MTEPRTPSGLRMLSRLRAYAERNCEMRAAGTLDAPAILAIEQEAGKLAVEAERERLRSLLAEQIEASLAAGNRPGRVGALEWAESLLTPTEEKELACDCRADTELCAGSTCTVCGHRDHGRSGCGGSR